MALDRTPLAPTRTQDPRLVAPKPTQPERALLEARPVFNAPQGGGSAVKAATGGLPTPVLPFGFYHRKTSRGVEYGVTQGAIIEADGVIVAEFASQHGRRTVRMSHDGRVSDLHDWVVDWTIYEFVYDERTFKGSFRVIPPEAAILKEVKAELAEFETALVARTAPAAQAASSAAATTSKASTPKK